MAKTAEDSAKEATKRKPHQHILLNVQDTDFAAWEAHYHATCRRDYIRADDQETIKDTKTIEEQTSSKTIYKNYFQYIIQYVMGKIV